MILFINNKNEIKDVNTTDDNSLTSIEIEDENNPFVDWSVAKICCYALNLENGKYKGFYPYVDTRIIEHLNKLSIQNTSLQIQQVSTQAQLDYVTMMSDIDI